MDFTIRCDIAGCGNSVDLPSVGGDRLSLENMTGWAHDDNGWRCPEHEFWREHVARLAAAAGPVRDAHIMGDRKA